MVHIIIKNIGPLSEADVYLKRINIIIGPQSQGKSTLLKIASYCSWVEKRIELTQTDSYFQSEDNFVNGLVVFHKMQGYIREGAFISYESDYMTFSYDFDARKFTFSWNKKRWEYRRPKISYIPSERNLVAAIPNWFELSFVNNNIRNFMIDWVNARKSITDNLPILNLNISYHYDSNKNEDEVMVGNNNSSSIAFTNTSSGLQSLIPLFVLLNYLYSTQYESEKAKRISGDWEDTDLVNTIYEKLFKEKGRTEGVMQEYTSVIDDSKVSVRLPYTKAVGGSLLKFDNEETYKEFNDIYNRYLLTDHNNVFLEEPENNLFPPTQSQVSDWIKEHTLGRNNNTLMIATHSPYVLNRFLEYNINDFALFFTANDNQYSKVCTATDEDIQAIYDDGVDAFFNIENLNQFNNN
jgi:predicted ATPase